MADGALDELRACAARDRDEARDRFAALEAELSGARAGAGDAREQVAALTLQLESERVHRQ